MTASKKTSDSERSAVDIAARRICDYISSGQFVAGQRLPEVDLVDQLGVSKTVLRETFVKLQQEGIIELQKFRGARVRRLSFDELMEILAANTILMAWAAHEAARAISADPSRVTALAGIGAHIRTFEPRDQREHLAVFYGLIDTIADLAGSTYLAELIARGFNPLVKEFLLDSIRFDNDVIDHTRGLDKVIERIEQADPEGAFDAFRKWTKLDRSWVRPHVETAE